jgi:hypothetical protein
VAWLLLGMLLACNVTLSEGDVDRSNNSNLKKRRRPDAQHHGPKLHHRTGVLQQPLVPAFCLAADCGQGLHLRRAAAVPAAQATTTSPAPPGVKSAATATSRRGAASARLAGQARPASSRCSRRAASPTAATR